MQRTDTLRWQCLLAAALACGGAADARAAAPAVALLEKHCAACHNPNARQGGLDVTSREALLRGGARGPALAPGNARASLLYQMVAHQAEPAMPFKTKKLPPAEIEVFERWIDAGASFDDSPAEPSLFASVVRPLFERQCVSCHHAAPGRASGLDLTSRAKLLEGGDHGPGVDPAQAESSLLIKRLRHEKKPGMPLNGEKLPEETIAKIVAWIKAGAPYDAPLAQPTNLTRSQPDRSHWAFQKPVRPAPPKVRQARWGRNPVDAFLMAEWEKRGLTPAPDADPRLLVRRLYLDLTGLPPTLDETREFLADRAPDAYEKLVDRLLASPRYGERWGRHWMDIWRYSDWFGRREIGDHRFSFPHIWRWRDWIIESLNQDKGYDRMLVEMLAADEIAPNDDNMQRATGYLARNFHRFNRHVWLQDTVEHLAVGVLGVTMKCARCHDHKYDPIAQEEYYQLRAFFEPHDIRTDRVPGQPNVKEDGLARVYETGARKGTVEPYSPPIYDKTFRLIRGEESNPDLSKEIQPGIPAVLGDWKPAIEPVKLPLEAAAPDLREFVARDLVAEAEREVRLLERALANARESVKQAQGLPPASGVVAEPKLEFPEPVRLLLRKRCQGCHGGAATRNGLAVGNLEALRRGGLLHGPAIVPGDSRRSPLMRYVRGEATPRMPHGLNPLAAEDVAQLARWIDAMPAEDPAAVLRKAEARVARLEKQLAAKRAAVPAWKARIEADVAAVRQPDEPRTKELAQAAREAERRAAVAQAEADVGEATQFLAEAQRATPADRAELDKLVAAAKTRLEAAAKVLGAASESYTPIITRYQDTSSGRRLALARWISGRDNPLTARVAVNHIWMRHFGRGLVPTVTNFGKRGKPPVSQALLDWLAVEFMDSGWSMKKLHRLLVTSRAYRMASSGANLPASSQKVDPENEFFWRMHTRRMEGEVVRDAALFLAGVMDFTQGGPDLDESLGLTSQRRSLYLRHTPDSQVEFLRLYDQPTPVECYSRPESVVPQQALASVNSLLTLDAARRLARSLEQRGGVQPDPFVRVAFETVLGLPPSPEELAASREFLSEQTALHRDPSKLTRFASRRETTVDPAAEPAARARENFVHALLNHTEFVTIR